MERLGRSLQVSHLSSSPLRTAFLSDKVSTVRAWASAAAINYVPVRRNGRIVGVLENVIGDLLGTDAGPRRASEEDLVHTAMRSLSSDMLIEGGQPLGGLVDELLKAPHYRLVVDGGQLESIVTPSDLCKLPMRVLVFSQVARLEATITDAIRRMYVTEEDAVSALGQGAQAQILGQLKEMHSKSLDPSLIELASLRQKAAILASRGVFAGDEHEVDADFKDLYERLRNPLMHAASFVDDSLDALIRLSRQLEFIQRRTAEASAGGR
ncbi:hypothetical protein DSM104299_02517 [Baekduia alba]|nr:hypothetical protein DSM104299_02517 [Baekduia alba]